MNEKRPEDIVNELLENHDEEYIKKICRNLLRRGFGPEGDRKWQHVLVIRKISSDRCYLSVSSQEFDFEFSVSMYSNHGDEFPELFEKAVHYLENTGWEMFQNIEDIDNGRAVIGMKRRVHKSETNISLGIEQTYWHWESFPSSVERKTPASRLPTPAQSSVRKKLFTFE